MTKRNLTGLLLGTTLLAGTGALAQDVTLTIESWRNDDLAIWQDTIIPAFEAEHPGIKVTFAPTAPAEYNAVLNSKLDAGSAGDLITCRPFDPSLGLYDKGQLTDLSDLPAMANFSDVAKAGWTTDDGSATFCVPMASVIHGFIYNKTAFEELGLEVPETEAEFFAVLDAIKEDGTYIPMAMGTNDQWEAATMGYQNIGPNYWKGEEGRLALIKGEQKLTDPQRRVARINDHVVLEVDDLFQAGRLHIEQRAEPAGHALEEPDVDDRRGQFDVAHPLAAHATVRHLDPAAVADHPLVLHTAVFAASTFPVLFGAEDPFAKQSILFRPVRTIIDRFRLLDFAE